MAGARLRGDRMAERRKAAGLLQGDLAAKLGTRDRRVGEWERGEQQPQPRYLLALAHALGVEPLSLLAVDQQDPPLLVLRLAAGLTLRELTAASRIPQTTYVRLEVGVSRSETTAAMVAALAATFGTDVEHVQRAVIRSRTELDARP